MKFILKECALKMKRTVRILTVPELRPLIDSMVIPDGVELLYAEENGGGIAELLFRVQPDAVIMNLFMRDTDAVEVIRAYRMLYADKSMYFTVVVPFATAMLQMELDQCGVDKVIRMPVDKREIASVIAELSLRSTYSSLMRLDSGIHAIHDVHSRYCVDSGETVDLDGILMELGFPRCDGLDFIRRAVILTLEAGRPYLSATGVIYPSVAREFGTTPSCAERRIRVAITKAWNSDKRAMLEAYFGNTIDVTRGKPSNSEFIAMLADRIRLETTGEINIPDRG